MAFNISYWCINLLCYKERDGSLCLVMDYLGLNKVMVQNRWALLLISSRLEHLCRAKYFTKLDLQNVYNLRIHPSNEWKTVFCPRYGNFECSTILDIFTIVYLNDIMIFLRLKRSMMCMFARFYDDCENMASMLNLRSIALITIKWNSWGI